MDFAGQQINNFILKLKNAAMSTLTVQESMKIYMMYIGSDCEYGFENSKYIGKVVGLDERFGIMVNNLKVLSPYKFVRHELCKLLLTPLSNITDEHAVEVAKILYGSDFYDNSLKNGGLVFHGKRVVDRLYFNPDNPNNKHNEAALPTTSKAIYVHQYLISKGYAVPLFFGIDHPCNGKTAIECGIAIVKK